MTATFDEAVLPSLQAQPWISHKPPLSSKRHSGSGGNNAATVPATAAASPAVRLWHLLMQTWQYTMRRVLPAATAVGLLSQVSGWPGRCDANKKPSSLLPCCRCMLWHDGVGKTIAGTGIEYRPPSALACSDQMHSIRSCLQNNLILVMCTNVLANVLSTLLPASSSIVTI